MPNPLFNSLFGRNNSQMPIYPSEMQDTGKTAPVAPQMTMQDAMHQLQSDPAKLLKQAGFNVPDEISGDPQRTVMHLIKSGQVGNPMMQRIAPMINRMLGRR